MHRQLSFEGGILTNTAADSSAAVMNLKAGKLSVANTIERIVIVGLKGKPSNWKVHYKGAAGQHMEAEPGPLKRMPGRSDAALVIRKPDLPVDQKWSLQLVPSSQEL